MTFSDQASLILEGLTGGKTPLLSAEASRQLTQAHLEAVRAVLDKADFMSPEDAKYLNSLFEEKT